MLVPKFNQDINRFLALSIGLEHVFFPICPPRPKSGPHSVTTIHACVHMYIGAMRMNWLAQGLYSKAQNQQIKPLWYSYTHTHAHTHLQVIYAHTHTHTHTHTHVYYHVIFGTLKYLDCPVLILLKYVDRLCNIRTPTSATPHAHLQKKHCSNGSDIYRISLNYCFCPWIVPALVIIIRLELNKIYPALE